MYNYQAVGVPKAGNKLVALEIKIRSDSTYVDLDDIELKDNNGEFLGYAGPIYELDDKGQKIASDEVTIKPASYLLIFEAPKDFTEGEIHCKNTI